MTDDALLDDSAEDLYENAPCGYLSTRLDGVIVKVNRTFETLTGYDRADLVGVKRLVDLLAPGGRIYHETHYAPLLQMQGAVREIAMEIVSADGTRLPVLINSTLRRDEEGRPGVIRTAVFDASHRRLYEEELLNAQQRQHDVALELQRSLLAGDLPQAPGMDLEVAYRPAVSGLEVGGDWYDAFRVERPDTIGLVVGDVVGRGIEAAATMGQLRSAVRALASTGLGPAALLEALDRYAHRHSVGRMATLVYAELDLSSRDLRYACAGHLPPAVIGPGVAPSFAWDGRSLPLAAFPPIEPREEGALTLPPGGGVVLYTDGLVERPSQSLEKGMDGLLEMIARQADSGSPLADPIVRAFHDSEHSDDVCVLAVRLSG